MSNEVVFIFRDVDDAREAAMELADQGVQVHVDPAGPSIAVPDEVYEQVSVTLQRLGGHAMHEADQTEEGDTSIAPPAGQA
ncbi:hypothetical protein [Luteococcus sanguinis]|uniref:Uncharacterized protein n=1 Tax=Luteococcus sanguinis TaxID=174038 RepID=A0ABW1X4F6_9ACTN